MNVHAPNTAVELGDAIERIVARLVREGRYASRDEVLRAGVLALEERASQIEWAKVPFGPDLGDDMEAVADIKAGRVHSLEEVAAELRARFGSP
jgi:Arc/MetJ-type ribon-helix-helix transcriptional regulator